MEVTAARSPLLVSLLALLALLAASGGPGGASACLITNCPRGGKRAALTRSREVRCTPCGPGRDGYCVGPGICCSPQLGCVLTAQGTCSRASALPPQCTPPPPRRHAAAAAAPPVGAPCGADLTPDGSAPGRCAAQGVCCTSDSCRIDALCLSREDNNDLPGPGFDSDLLRSVRQLSSDTNN